MEHSCPGDAFSVLAQLARTVSRAHAVLIFADAPSADPLLVACVGPSPATLRDLIADLDPPGAGEWRTSAARPASDPRGPRPRLCALGLRGGVLCLLEGETPLDDGNLDASLHLRAPIEAVLAARQTERENHRLRRELDTLRTPAPPLAPGQAPLREVIERLDAGFLMYDAEDRLSLCNAAYNRLYPLSADLMVPGATYGAILRAVAERGAAEEGAPREQWIAAHLAEHLVPQSTREVQVAGRWLSITDQRTSDGGFVSLRTDITSLREAQLAAEAATRAKSEFLSTMSHEIRTPLNGVIGMLSLLHHSPLDAEQREYVEVAQRSGEVLLSLLNDVLDFSRLEAGRLQTEQLPFSPRLLLEEALGLIGERAHHKGLELLGSLQPGTPDEVEGNPSRIRQVLLNLLGNAVKFTEAGEVELRVRYEAAAELLSFTVRDTGIGVAPEAKGSLFEAFRQADGSTARRFGGSGLGLAISRRIADLLGGSIDLESTLGVGTTFTARFPVTAPRGLATPAPLTVGRVLCVTENTRLRQVLVETLREAGIDAEALPATDAGRLERAEAAVAIVDLASVPAASWQAAAMPVVLLVPLGRTDTFGAAAIVRKPFRQGALISALRTATLRQKRVVRHPETGAPTSEGSDHAARPGAATKASPAGSGSAQSAPDLPNREEPIAPPTRPEAPARPRPQVLVAEDNPVNQRLVSAMLTKLGCDVSLVDCGQAALDAADARTFDLVFMDCQMPGVDGFEATRALRDRENAAGGSRQPIVAITANAQAGDRQRCLDAGMDDYLPKPVRLEDLRDALARWLVSGERAGLPTR